LQGLNLASFAPWTQLDAAEDRAKQTKIAAHMDF
jgi:hypothetical protein